MFLEIQRQIEKLRLLISSYVVQIPYYGSINVVVKRQTLGLHIMFDNVFYVEACEQITLGDVGSNIDLKIMGWFLVCIKVEAFGIFVLLSLTIETWGNKESFLADVQAIVALILLPYNISIILRLNGV